MLGGGDPAGLDDALRRAEAKVDEVVGTVAEAIGLTAQKQKIVAPEGLQASHPRLRVRPAGG